MPPIPRKITGAVADPKIQRRQPTAGVAALESGVQAVAESATNFGATIKQVASNLEKRTERMNKEKRLNKANDIYNTSYKDAVLVFADELNNDGRSNANPDLPDESPTVRFNRITSEILDRNLEGLDEDQQAYVRTRMSERQRYWDEKVALKQTTDIAQDRVKNLNQITNSHSAAVFADAGSLENIRKGLDVDIAASGLRGEDAQDKKIEIEDKLAHESLLGIAQTKPKTALKILESGAYDDLFKDPDSKRELEKQIKLKKSTQEKEIDAAKTKNDNDILFDAMGKGYLDPAQRQRIKTKEGIKTWNKLAKDKATEIKQAKKDAQYRTTITNKELAAMDNMSILNLVDDPDDAKKIITYRDSITKNPSVNGRVFDEILVQLKKDFTADKFGTKESVEANLEYTKQVRAFQSWAVANPTKDPTEYYERTIAPINEGFFSKTFGLGRDPSVVDRPASREREEWVGRATKANPDYTEEELLKFWDENIKGTE